MPTQIDANWLPSYSGEESRDMIGAWMGVRQVRIEVAEILSHIMYRGYRGTESTAKMKKIPDSHSALTSDDLLWYIGGMRDEEIAILRTIKIKGDSLTLPRTLSAQIRLALEALVP